MLAVGGNRRTSVTVLALIAKVNKTGLVATEIEQENSNIFRWCIGPSVDRPIRDS